MDIEEDDCKGVNSIVLKWVIFRKCAIVFYSPVRPNFEFKNIKTS
jgi:hypothetical protein